MDWAKFNQPKYAKNHNSINWNNDTVKVKWGKGIEMNVSRRSLNLLNKVLNKDSEQGE